ncbi:MAG: hypothetical protein N2653_03520 [Burkholderiales bacterium]|nr:hypothetical protein [Burkholderiales bacterium]
MRWNDFDEPDEARSADRLLAEALARLDFAEASGDEDELEFDSPPPPPVRASACSRARRRRPTAG